MMDIPPPPVLKREDATYPWKYNNYIGMFRGEHRDGTENGTYNEAYYIIETAKFVNGEIDFTTLSNIVPYVSDKMFKFDSGESMDYKIDIGHYMFRTIRMMLKITDTEQATNEGLNLVNKVLSNFKNTPIYSEFIEDIDSYVNDTDKKTEYIGRIIGVANDEVEPMSRLAWLVYSLFVVNMLSWLVECK